MITRRNILASGAAMLTAGAASLLQRAPLLAAATRQAVRSGKGGYVPVVTPNGSTLPWRWEDGCKTFHLIAAPLVREFAPGFRVNCWGYNGQTPGPTIEAVEGERVRIYVEQPPPRAHHRALARRDPAQRHGRRRRPQPAADRARRDLRVRVLGAAARHLHVPPALRRDGAEVRWA